LLSPSAITWIFCIRLTNNIDLDVVLGNHLCQCQCQCQEVYVRWVSV
jgi:hypothetical protein